MRGPTLMFVTDHAPRGGPRAQCIPARRRDLKLKKSGPSGAAAHLNSTCRMRATARWHPDLPVRSVRRSRTLPEQAKTGNGPAETQRPARADQHPDLVTTQT